MKRGHQAAHAAEFRSLLPAAASRFVVALVDALEMLRRCRLATRRCRGEMHEAKAEHTRRHPDHFSLS
jgi:hypothetical protein